MYQNKRRRSRAPLLLVVLLVVGGALARAVRPWEGIGNDRARAVAAGWSTSPDAVRITAPPVTFLLPAEPTLTPSSETIGGVIVNATNWRIDRRELFTDVTLMSFPAAPPESMSAVADDVVRGIVQRSGGTLVSDNVVAGDPGPQRHVTVELDSGYMYSVVVVIADSVVVMSSAGELGAAPPLFTEMVATLRVTTPG